MKWFKRGLLFMLMLMLATGCQIKNKMAGYREEAEKQTQQKEQQVGKQKTQEEQAIEEELAVAKEENSFPLKIDDYIANLQQVEDITVKQWEEDGILNVDITHGDQPLTEHIAAKPQSKMITAYSLLIEEASQLEERSQATYFTLGLNIAQNFLMDADLLDKTLQHTVDTSSLSPTYAGEFKVKPGLTFVFTPQEQDCTLLTVYYEPA